MANDEAEADRRFLQHLGKEIAERNLGAPAIFFLEMNKPFCRIGGQLLIFLDPILKLFVDIPEYDRLIRLMEDPENVERLILAIEASEAVLHKKQVAKG
jgi:hypothetical protein